MMRLNIFLIIFFISQFLILQKSFHAELESLLLNPVEPPKHLRDQVPEELKYQLCGDAFVMALVYQGAWNGWYKNEYAGRNEKVPAMVICIGKEV